ncbi:biorientation of chromosomes in cell division protein 1-like 1 isoform X2 [Phymastichus coffea]|uniref:biorientation of chromosomes in cell division protein 1-like 1 isoform X2 n=1 Tax=Phymastichus coffea TaxID=108790 RepID=UPI00273C0AB8|nr:biorientation of chromosomes in cell division protein 1-like 1 isoform X2 [Phymastichus coffea]
MDLGLGNTLLPGDPRLIDHIVAEVKSQGIFDQFRKECIADVDTKPAYQNLNSRVESSVNSFLNKQVWKADLNKNQLRETLRKHIHDAPYLEVGVDRIVDQVVNPKVYSVFMPKIEDVVYKYLGIERPKPQRNGACDLKDLLPTDLDPVSPESDRGSIKDESMDIVEEDEKKVINGNEEKPSVSNIESKPLEVSASPVKKENINIENEKGTLAMDISPVKAVLNASFKLDEGIKTEEEEEESPDFEPIDTNLNESNMSNDSHLSGISELTSHRSGSPDFAIDFARDNFDYSNQDSQLSKVSSNSRLSIVTDIGSSNHGSTPKLDVKEDFKSSKDNFKAVKEFESNKDNKFNFDVAKIKDNSKTSTSSKESSRDASDYKDVKLKDESKSKSSKEKHESRNSKGKDRDSKKRHSRKRRYRSRSKDKTESDSQESKDFYQKPKEIKIKEIDKKDDTLDETSDLKDRYKEKIRELREKIELTEKGKLGKVNPDLAKDKRDSVSLKDKEDPKKSSHKSSSTRNSSHSKSSRNSEIKESRDKNSSRHEERHRNNGKGESKSSSKSRRDSKSGSRSSDRSKDKKRRDEKKPKSTDDHSSLRKNLNDRRSSDRDGSDGSSSKYSQKTSFNANTSSNKFGPTSELTKDNKEQYSSGEVDNVQETLRGNDGLPKKVDPGSLEISLPLKKRRLLSEDSQDENPSKKKRSNGKRALKRKLEHLDSFKSDSDVASVPDEERVQIVEYADEEYDQPYPDRELILSLEETKKIILDAEPVTSSKPSLSKMEQSILSEMMADNNMTDAIVKPKKVILDGKLIPPSKLKLSEMEQSIRQSLSEMMAEHKLSDTDNEPKKINPDVESVTSLEPNMSEMDQSIHSSLSKMMTDHKTSESDVEPVKVSTVMDSSSLLEALTDDSSTDKKTLAPTNTEDVISDSKATEVEKFEEIAKGNSEESKEILNQSYKNDMKIKTDDRKVNKEISENIQQQEMDKVEDKASEVQRNTEKEVLIPKFKIFSEIEKEESNEVSKVQKSKAKVISQIEISCKIEKEQNTEMLKIKENIESLSKVEKSNEIEIKVGTELSKIKEDRENIPIIEKSNKIEMKAGTELAKMQQNTENIVPQIEKSDVIDKNKKIDNSSITNKVMIESDSKSKNEIAQDEENQADSDEFNEDDTLVIDEDAEEKEKEKVKPSEVFETSRESEKIEEKRRKKSNDESQSNDIEILEVFYKNHTSDVQNNTEDKLNNKPAKQINNEDVEKSTALESNDNFSIKPVEFDDEPKDEIKNQLINELAKLDENDSDEDKHEIKELTSNESVNKDDVSIEVIKLDDSPDKSDNTMKLDSDDDGDVNIDEIKDDDEDSKAAEDKIEEFDPLSEVSLDVEKVTVNEGQDSLGVDKSEVYTDPLATDSSNQEQPMEEAHCSTDNRWEYSVEEDCHYFDNDNQKYLSFRKYLDQLEANLIKDTEKEVETPIRESSPVVKPVEPLTTDSVPLKRKHSLSPIADIIKDNNNGGLITTKEQIVTEVSQEVSAEESMVVLKKRKVGRMKKSNSSSSVTSSSSQSEQPQVREQQSQVAHVNGENLMPLSPESDISVCGDKNLTGHAREERSRGQRSSQRYSSDDLYKPRPLFTSSSRRTTRRYHQA